MSPNEPKPSESTRAGEDAPEPPASAPPLSDRLCEFVCLTFALWTVLCNAVVWTGGSLTKLIWVEALGFPLALSLGIALFYAVHRLGRPSSSGISDNALEHDPEGAASESGTVGLRLRQTAAVLSLLALLAFPLFNRLQIFWWLSLLILGLGLASLFLDRWRLAYPMPRASLRWEAALWGIALAAVAFNLTVHRPDTDDSLYLNISADAADSPSEPLMSIDRMQGIEGLSFHSPVYLSNSIEPLWAVTSYLTGLNAQLWFHVVHAGLGAFFIVLAYAALFRLLAPDRWLLATCVLILILLGAGGPQNHWYGNLAFVRVWQGKCTFLHVFLPLTFAYGMRFAMRPSLYGFLLLGAAQIAAVGMSSTAVWVEPLAAGTGMLCGAPLHRFRGWLRVFIGCFASSYILGVGLHLKALMEFSTKKILKSNFRLRDYKTSTGFQEVLDVPGQALQWAWINVLGEGVLLYLCLGAMLLAWVVVRSPLARRFTILLPLLTLIFIMNPYTERWVMANVVGPVYYRSTWLIPLPVFLTFLFLAILDLDPKRVPRKTAIFFLVVMLAGYVSRVSEFNPYDRKNGVFYGAPDVKIFPEVRQVLRQAQGELPPGAYVLAPTQFGFWFPTFHEPLYPLVVNKWYTLMRHREITRKEVDWRIELTEYVSGENRLDDSPDRLRKGVDFFGVQGVIVDRRSAWRDEVDEILEEMRFRPLEALDYRGEARYQLWVRPEDDPGVREAPRWKILELRD